MGRNGAKRIKKGFRSRAVSYTHLDVYKRQIWSNNPSSAKVVYEFLQFKGSGKKIATMAANILARQFKIPFSDYYSIDISPDVHILRVMRRTGLVDNNADLDSIIYKARELNPEFPGIIDFSCWEIGRTCLLYTSIAEMTDFLNTQTGDITEFDDKLVRKLVEKAIVYDDRLVVEFKSGLEIEVNL